MTKEEIPGKRPGLAFGILASLPLVETLLYNAHVGPGRQRLPNYDYVLLALLSLLLIALHVLCFVTPQGKFKQLLDHFRKRLAKTRERFRENISYMLLALPVLFLIIFFGGEPGLKLLIQSDILTAALLPLFLFGLVILLIWAISKIIEALAQTSRTLGGAMNEWAFSIKSSAVFYLLLVAATLRVLSLSGIRKEAHLEFSLGITKDYFLMFITAGMLFTGLYKIGMANSLKLLFQSQRGLLYFILICGVIAIMAIAADFNGMSAPNQERIFTAEWQKQMNRAHVYGRDIGLLLLPIASLLFWALKRIALEIDEKDGKTANRGD